MKKLPEHTIKRPLNSVSLINFFNDRCEIWPYPMISGECFTMGLFSGLVIKPYEAFQLIPTAIQIVFDNQYSKFLTNACELLSTLIAMSDTTEMPLSLNKSLSSLNEMVDKNSEKAFLTGCWDSICKHYRIKASTLNIRGK